MIAQTLEGASMRPALSGALIVVIAVLAAVAVSGCIAAAALHGQVRKWRDRSQHWFSVAMGEKPMIDTGNAKRMMNDLFPRPMGAVPRWSEVTRGKEFREYRALHALDHHTRHFAEGVTDSEVAREILQFTVGGWEKDV